MALIKVNTRGQSSDFSSGRNFHNRIINGDMRIRQRNITTSTINAAGVTYNVDRWLGRGAGSAGVFTLVQDSESPNGFTKSLKATVTTADSSIAAGSSYRVMQHVEGYNMNDLGWGSSSAQNVMLSFWVRSSVTGTFGGSFANGDYNRFRTFSYTISSANTWEKKTVSIPGDTSGSWSYTTDLGIRLNFSIGAGSSKVGSTGAWGTSSIEGATGQANLISTNNATFYLTGVKLEAGTTATDFESRQFGDELLLCQRYYYQLGGTSGYSMICPCFGASTQELAMLVKFPVDMRQTPAVSWESNSTLTFRRMNNGSHDWTPNGVNAMTTGELRNYGGAIWFGGFNHGQSQYAAGHVRVANGSNSLRFDAEI